MPASKKDSKPSWTQIPVRLHPDEHKMIRKLLIDDSMSFQELMTAFIQAYLRGDPVVMKVVKTYRSLLGVPKEKQAEYVLSQRDRDDILRQIEVEVSKGEN